MIPDGKASGDLNLSQGLQVLTLDSRLFHTSEGTLGLISMFGMRSTWQHESYSCSACLVLIFVHKSRSGGFSYSSQANMVVQPSAKATPHAMMHWFLRR